MDKPLPTPTPVTRPFWEGLRAREVRIQRCAACRAWVFYPRAFCPECLSPELEWHPVSGQGTLYTYTISRRPTFPCFADEVPQKLAVVALDEGPHLTSTLVNVAESDIQGGMRLEPVFEAIPDKNVTLLRYQPAEASVRSRGVDASVQTSDSTTAEEKPPSVLTPEILAYIGKQGEPVQGYPISEHEIRRFCYAVDDLNPRFIDPQAAGPDGIEAPPMFLAIPFDSDVALSELSEDGIPTAHKGMVMPPLPLKRRLWGGTDVEFFETVRPGDCLTRQNKIVEIREQAGRSGPLVFVIVETIYTNQRGNKVATETNTIIAR